VKTVDGVPRERSDIDQGMRFVLARDIRKGICATTAQL